MKKLLMLVVTLMLGASLAIAQTDSNKSSGSAEKPAASAKSSKKTAKKAPAKKDAKKGASDKKDASSK